MGESSRDATVTGAWRRQVRAGVLAAAALTGFGAQAQSSAVANPFDQTRSSAFDYYTGADGVLEGLLKSETVEPNDPSLCVRTTYTYDAYGNRNGATTAACAGASTTSTFASRASSTTFGAIASQTIVVAGTSTSVPVPAGAYPTTAKNALSQSAQQAFDPRFGTQVALTGPNGLTTSWSYDDFGRKIRESHADGTSVVMLYCFLSGDTSANSAGCANLSYAAGEIPTGAYMVVHSEPHNASDGKMGAYARVFADAEGRTLRTSTQSFDGAAQPTGVGRVVVQDTVYSAIGTAIVVTQPYFLATGSSTTTGALDVGATYTQYDKMGRPIHVFTADSKGSQPGIQFGTLGTRTAALTSFTYDGNTTITTDDKNRNRTEEKDILGNVVRITDPGGAQLARQFDAEGNLVQTKDAAQNLVTLTYDLRGHKLSLMDPDSGLTQYCYDALGQLKAQQTAKMRGNSRPSACPTDIAATTTATAESGWTTLAYDVLGRVRQRAEPEDTSTWAYDAYLDGSACNKGIGQLCESTSTVGASHRYSYDNLGRLASSAEKTNAAGTAGFPMGLAYDASTGRVSSKTYPSGLQVNYTYTAGGFPNTVTLGSQVTVNPLPHTAGGTPAPSVVLPSGTALWTAGSADAWGHAVSDTLSNGVADSNVFDASTGRALALKAGVGAGATGVLNLAYLWDSVGRVQTRTDNNGAGNGHAVVDSYQYDTVDRLTQYAVQGPDVPNMSRTVTMNYDAIGNLWYKSDVGTYGYAPSGNTGGATLPLPHAIARLTPISGAATAYYYDAGGNLTYAGGGKYGSISYTSFNLPDASGGASGAAAAYTYVYDENHQRIRESRTDSSGTQVTWFANPDNGAGLSFESEVTPAGVVNNRHYIAAGGHTIVIVTTAALPALTATQTAPAYASAIVANKIEYWHQDALGNLIATTDQAHTVTAYYAYDPFGKRRPAGGAYDANGNLVVPWSTTLDNGTGRGFTTHEQLDDIGLVHMNGRLFDPMLGRFLQPDPQLQSPEDLQNYNRYSYCFNNPITCTDPSGQSAWLSRNVWSANPTKNFLANAHAFDPAGYWLATRTAHTQIGYEIGSVAIGVVSAVYCGAAAAACDAGGMAMWSAFAGYSNNQILRVAVISGVTAELNYEVGSNYPGYGQAGATSETIAENTAGHVLVGCASAVMERQSCGSGAASGFVSAAWTNYVQADIPGSGAEAIIGNTVVHAAVGGLASVAGGGSFKDGATVGAFDYLFNAGAHAIQANRAAGIRFETMRVEQLEAEGIEVARNVGIEFTTADGEIVRAVADYVYLRDGEIIVGEVKWGLNAKFSSAQKTVYEAIVAGKNFAIDRAPLQAIGITDKIYEAAVKRFEVVVSELAGRAARQALTRFGVRAIIGLGFGLEIAGDLAMLSKDAY
ncbi:MAG: RHS repeat-associated core domain-containing protein [Burkholderiaceae bacterium]